MPISKLFSALIHSIEPGERMTGDRCVPNWNLLCERELHDCDYTIDRSPREFLYEVILERLSNRCAATRAQIDELFKKNREETCKKKSR